MQVEHIRLLATNGVDVSLGDYDDRYLLPTPSSSKPLAHTLLPTLRTLLSTPSCPHPLVHALLSTPSCPLPPHQLPTKEDTQTRIENSIS